MKLQLLTVKFVPSQRASDFFPIILLASKGRHKSMVKIAIVDKQSPNSIQVLSQLARAAKRSRAMHPQHL